MQFIYVGNRRGALIFGAVVWTRLVISWWLDGSYLIYLVNAFWRFTHGTNYALLIRNVTDICFNNFFHLYADFYNNEAKWATAMTVSSHNFCEIWQNTGG